MEQHYRNQDIGISSALYTVGFQFIGVEKKPNGNFDFIFKNEDTITDVIALFYQNKLKVSSLALLNNYRMLKNLIHTQR